MRAEQRVRTEFGPGSKVERLVHFVLEDHHVSRLNGSEPEESLTGTRRTFTSKTRYFPLTGPFRTSPILWTWISFPGGRFSAGPLWACWRWRWRRRWTRKTSLRPPPCRRPSSESGHTPWGHTRRQTGSNRTTAGSKNSSHYKWRFCYGSVPAQLCWHSKIRASFCF